MLSSERKQVNENDILSTVEENQMNQDLTEMRSHEAFVDGVTELRDTSANKKEAY